MEVSFCLLDVDYFVENEKPVIRIHGKTEQEPITIFDKNFLPYIYVLPNGEIGHLRNLILNSFSRIPVKKIEEVKKNYFGKELVFLKVSILYPSDIKDLKEELESWKSVKKVFEHDIHFYKRYIIDKNIYPFKWYKAECEQNGSTLELVSMKEIDSRKLELKTLAIDIETEDEKVSSVILHGKDFSRKIVGEEKTILEKFIHEIMEHDPDVICGYDTDSFIFPALMDAAKRNSIPFEIGRFAGEPMIKKTGRITTYYFRGRINIDLSYESIDRSEDALKNFEKMFPKFVALSYVSGQTIFDVTRMDSLKVLEWIMIREALKGNEVIPNKANYEEAEKRKSSGYKKEVFVSVKEGLYENLCKADIRPVYKNIITSHNISPETLNCDCCKRSIVSSDLAFIENRVPGEQYYFCTHHTGFFTKVIEHMESQKTSEKKEILEIIFKTLHTYFNNPWSRWYSAICAKSIISWGKENLLKWFGNKWENIIYADTDFIFTPSETINSIALAEVEKSFFEKGFIFHGNLSPKYILLEKSGNIIDKGFEKNKSDWAEITKETYSKALELILKDGKMDEALELFNETMKKISEEKIPLEKLAMETKLAKNINDYEKNDPHVSAAKKALELGIKIAKGETIRYVITKDGKTVSEKSALVDYAKNYDTEYYSNQMESACKKFFETRNTEKDNLSKFMEKN